MLRSGWREAQRNPGRIQSRARWGGIARRRSEHPGPIAGTPKPSIQARAKSGPPAKPKTLYRMAGALRAREAVHRRGAGRMEPKQEDPERIGVPARIAPQTSAATRSLPGGPEMPRYKGLENRAGGRRKPSAIRRR